MLATGVDLSFTKKRAVKNPRQAKEGLSEGALEMHNSEKDLGLSKIKHLCELSPSL